MSEKGEIRIPPTPRALAVFESRGFAMEHHAETCAKIKSVSATLWTLYDSITPPPGDTEISALLARAKQDLEISSMLGVKALSRFSPSSLL